MIYFIRSENKHIKIGYSVDPEMRLKELQTGCPTKLHLQATMVGTFQTEKGLHELLGHLKVRGEWFRYTDELRWFIRAVKENPTEFNIKTLYMVAQNMRITAKAKRLGAQHKLSKRIKVA